MFSSSRQSVEEAARQMKREASRGQRDIGRDLAAMEREEQKLVLQVKRAKTPAEQHLFAKQIVQIRQEKSKLIAAQNKLGSLKTTAATMKATHTVAQTMSNTAKTMASMNKTMDVNKMQANVKSFERMMQQQEMSEEMMNEALSGAFDAEEEGEVDEVVNQTLLSLGVDLTKNMQSAPTHRVKVKQQEEEEEDVEVERMMRELLRG